MLMNGWNEVCDDDGCDGCGCGGGDGDGGGGCVFDGWMRIGFCGCKKMDVKGGQKSR